jgi:hypothetical protein
MQRRRLRSRKSVYGEGETKCRETNHYALRLLVTSQAIPYLDLGDARIRAGSTARACAGFLHWKVLCGRHGGGWKRR